MKCTMVSLDTSSTVSGYAVYTNGRLNNYGSIDFQKEKNGEIRLENMCLGLTDLLNRYKPSIVVAELTVVERNAHTQRILSEILGVVRGWSLCHAAEFVEYRPTVWRRLVADADEKIPNKRNEAKQWGIDKVRTRYQIHTQDDNVSDAILVGQARINEFHNM